MKKITKPTQFEHANYYENFIGLVNENVSVLDQLKNNAKLIETLLLSLSESQLTTPYADGKWCIKDILQHLVDCERVFVYRAMRFARHDKSAQPFFEENDYAKAKAIPLKKLLKEYKTTRQSTIAFFNNLSADTFKRAGIAGNTSTTVRAIAWIICGHELHHWGVIKEKYLE